MKKLILIGFICYLAFTALPVQSVAQETRQQRFERIEAEKIAFITKELDLTTREAQRFFPYYNAYRKELHGVLEANRSKRMEQNRGRNRVDQLEVEAEVLAIKKKYRLEFEKVVGPARASRFFEVEREFREQLYKELSRRGRRVKPQGN